MPKVNNKTSKNNCKRSKPYTGKEDAPSLEKKTWIKNDKLISIWSGETDYQDEIRKWIYIKRCGKTVNFGLTYTNYVVKRLLTLVKENGEAEYWKDLKEEVEKFLDQE